MEVNITAEELSELRRHPGNFPETSWLGPAHPDPASQGADPCPVTNKQTEGLLLLSPGLLGSCHEVVTGPDSDISLGWFTFRKESMAGTKGGKGKSSPRAFHSTAKGRESFKTFSQTGDNEDFLFLINLFQEASLKLVPPARLAGSTRLWVSPCQHWILWQLLI